MYVFQCDSCGDIHVEHKIDVTVKPPAKRKSAAEMFPILQADGTTYQLCPRCAEQIDKFLAGDD